VAAVFVPGACRGDVVGCAFSLVGGVSFIIVEVGLSGTKRSTDLGLLSGLTGLRLCFCAMDRRVRGVGGYCWSARLARRCFRRFLEVFGRVLCRLRNEKGVLRRVVG
jgi:hypothetical protein